MHAEQVNFKLMEFNLKFQTKRNQNLVHRVPSLQSQLKKDIEDTLGSKSRIKSGDRMIRDGSDYLIQN